MVVIVTLFLSLWLMFPQYDLLGDNLNLYLWETQLLEYLIKSFFQALLREQSKIRETPPYLYLYNWRNLDSCHKDSHRPNITKIIFIYLSL